MIAVIDTTSSTLHACFELLTAAGETVMVFHSPETFVDTGAVFKSELLILGRTAQSIQECGPLQWAGEVRPELQTFLLHPSCKEVCRLLTVCQRPELQQCSCDSANCVDALRKAWSRRRLLQRRGRLPRPEDLKLLRKAA